MGEAIIFTGVLALANTWHAPFLFGRHPVEGWIHDARGAGTVSILTIGAFLTAMAVYIPVRSCVMWQLLLIGLVLHGTIMFTLESPFPDSVR